MNRDINSPQESKKRFLRDKSILKKIINQLKKNLFPKKKHSYFFERINTKDLKGTERCLINIENMLNYTKTSESSYSGKKFPAGYHTIKFNGKFFKGQRDPRKRYDSLNIDFKEKTVLDIGCNQGGMLFEISDKLKWGVGLDYDYNMINVANKIKHAKGTKHLEFYCFNLDKDNLSLIEDFLPEEKVDFVFLLAVCMWIKRWKEVINFASEISNAMIFESNGTNEQKSEQVEFLKQNYKLVKLISEKSEDDQKRRQLYICKNEY